MCAPLALRSRAMPTATGSHAGGPSIRATLRVPPAERATRGERPEREGKGGAGFHDAARLFSGLLTQMPGERDHATPSHRRKVARGEGIASSAGPPRASEGCSSTLLTAWSHSLGKLLIALAIAPALSTRDQTLEKLADSGEKRAPLFDGERSESGA